MSEKIETCLSKALLEQGGAALAQWIRQRLPSCGNGFKSHVHPVRLIYRQTLVCMHCEIDENETKWRPGSAPK